MRIGSRSYTFIIAGDADGKVRHFYLSYPVLLSIAFFALVGMITAGAGAHRLCRMIAKAQEYDHLLAENDSFRTENHTFGIQTAILGEKIDFLETMAHKLSIISGLNSKKSVGGIGGISRDSFRQAPTPSKVALSSFDRYGKSVSELERLYRGMNEFLSRKALLASAVPDRLPVRGYVSAAMGLREDPFNSSVTERHSGVDISAPYGTAVCAPADGVVIFAGQRAGYGNMVVIDHRFGTVTRYGHLSSMAVKVGRRVVRSEVIGYVGTSGRTTGPHLHYEVLSHNVLKDPMRFLSRNTTE